MRRNFYYVPLCDPLHVQLLIALPTVARAYLRLPTPLRLQTTLREQIAFYTERHEEHQKRKAEQINKISEQLETLHSLWARLGTTIKSECSEVGQNITDARLASLKTEIDDANTEIKQRQATVVELCKEIAEQIEELKLEDEGAAGTSDSESKQQKDVPDIAGPDVALTLTRTAFTALDKQVVNGEFNAIGVHSETLKVLEARSELLAKMRAERDAKLREMAQKITHLWLRLAVPQEVQQAWIRNHKGLSIKSLRSCQDELRRLLVLKAENLAQLIKSARVKLAALWDEMQFGSDRERKEQFPAFFTNECTDEILDAHEEMTKKMEIRCNAMRPLLKLVAKREQLRTEQAEFEKSQLDPNRFKIAGRMILEEKTRKRLAQQIPKADAELRANIPVWEKQYGDFCVDGRRYLETMDSDIAEEQMKKEEEKAAKEREKQLKKLAANGGGGGAGAGVGAGGASVSGAAVSAGIAAGRTTPTKHHYDRPSSAASNSSAAAAGAGASSGALSSRSNSGNNVLTLSSSAQNACINKHDISSLTGAIKPGSAAGAKKPAAGQKAGVSKENKTAAVGEM